ncbi:MAG: phosphatase PAP2 family protein [Pedobacter sp.]
MKNYIAETIKGNQECLKNNFSRLPASITELLKTFFINLKLALQDNSVLIFISIIYYLFTVAIGYYLHKKITYSIAFYYVEFFKYCYIFIFIYFSAIIVTYLVIYFNRGFSAFPLIWSRLRSDNLCSSTIARFLVIFSIIPLFISSYSSLKQTIPFFNNYSLDPLFYRIDKLLHFNNSPWEIIQPIIGHPAITQFIDFCYLSWGSLFVYSLLYMACHANKRLRMQFFISLACCWILIGNILAVLLSSAGPCYFSEVTGTSISPYEPLFQYLRSIPNLWAVGIQSALWKASQAGTFMPFGGISAMPSMHVSIAVLMTLLYRRVARWLGWLMIGFAVIIQIGSIHLGWHYAVDGYLSALLTVVIWKSVEIFFTRKMEHGNDLEL